MRYEGTIYRPPGEANSLLLQVTIGCQHNKCSFCSMYKAKKYSVRALQDVIEDIRLAKEHYGKVRKVFLCDGDALALETDHLLQILSELKRQFPKLGQVSCYGSPISTFQKSVKELQALRDAGLKLVYLGLETGDDALLKRINKGVTRGEMIQAGQQLVEAGMKLCLMIILGLTGKSELSKQHALATADAINQIKPHQLAPLTLTPEPGTLIYQQVKAGQLELMEPLETLEELKLIIQEIAVDKLAFIGTHPFNYLPINGRLQKDKQELISLIDNLLELKKG